MYIYIYLNDINIKILYTIYTNKTHESTTWRQILSIHKSYHKITVERGDFVTHPPHQKLPGNPQVRGLRSDLCTPHLAEL